MKTSLLTSPIGFAVLFGSSGAAPEPAAPVLEVFGGVSQDVPIANGDASPATADGTDFGLYRCGVGIVNKDFLLVNSGDADLEITDIDVPSGFAIGDSFPFTIPAGDDYTLNIETDATANTSQVWSGDVVIHSTELDDYTFAITGSTVYSARVLATTPIAFWKLNETSGSTITDSSGNAYNGAYTGVDLNNTASPVTGENAPYWDGTNDYGNLYSASFASAFNLDEGTVMIWLKVQGSGVWTDTALRQVIEIQRNSNNLVRIQKTTTNNTVLFRRVGNATTKSITVGSQSSTGWLCYAISWSIAGGGLLSAGDTRAYIDGSQAGATQTASAAGAGSGLSSTVTVAGAATITPTSVWNGYLSHIIVWNVPMSNAMLALMAI